MKEIEPPLLAEAYGLWYLLCMEEFRQIMTLAEIMTDEGLREAARTDFESRTRGRPYVSPL